MKSRYPLLRLELYQTHQQARDAFKEAKASFKDMFEYRMSDLSMEDKCLKVIFTVCDISLLKGLLADKIVIHFPMCVTDELYNEIKSRVNPKTTVENPIVLKGSTND